MSREYTAKQEGYAFLYVSNESRHRSGGATWTAGDAGGGEGGSYAVFGTSYEAFDAGVSYNDRHNSWQHTEGGSFEAAVKAFEGEARTTYLRGTTITNDGISGYQGEPYRNKKWLADRIKTAFVYAIFRGEQTLESGPSVPIFLQSVDARSLRMGPIQEAWYGYARFKETFSLPGRVPFTRRTITVTRNLSIMVVNKEFSRREVQENVARALNLARVALWRDLADNPGMSSYDAGLELQGYLKFTLIFQGFTEASVTPNYHSGSPDFNVKFTWVPVPLQP